MDARGITRGIDQHAALRFGCGDLVKSLAQTLVKGMVEPLETIRIAGASRDPRMLPAALVAGAPAVMSTGNPLRHAVCSAAP